MTEPAGVDSRVWTAYSRGEHLDLRTGDPAEDDTANAERWGADRTIPAAAIRAVLLGGVAADRGHVARVRISGARIVGVLDLEHVEVSCALELNGCAFTDPPQLSYARLRSVEFEGSELPGLDAFAATIDGTFGLIGARITANLSLYGARITGDLDLDQAQLHSPASGGDALSAASVDIGRHLYGHGLHAHGDVDLNDARIGGSIRFEHVSDLPVCRVEGMIQLSNAQVRGAVALAGAQLVNPGGAALRANRLEVGGGFFCDGGFRAEGGIKLYNCRIGGLLRIRDAELTAPGGTALTLWSCDIRELAWQPGRPVDGTVDLRHSQVGVLADDPTAWPARLRLDGLTYQALNPPLTARARLDWLDRDPAGYAPQPYEQLAAAYARLGHDDEARAVRYARLRRQRRTLTPLARGWGLLQDWTVGYGFRPLRAAIWLLILLAAGTLSFALHHPQPATPGQAPDFNPVVYAFDLLLPLVDFGQQQAYIARGAQQWLAYGLIATGWILVTTIAAGIARTLSRQ